MEGSPYINVFEREKIAELEFFHPKSNALSAAMLQELADEISILGKRSDINVIVLKSYGKVFCAGAFFDELLEVKDSIEGEQFFLGFAKVILAIKSAKALVLTKVQGKAVGGAVGIIAASDYVICSETSQVRLSELNIGIGPFVISPVIKSKISNSSFMHLALNPKVWFNTDWLLSKGMINEVVSATSLEEATQSKIEEFASFGSQAVHQLKETGSTKGLEKEMNSLAKVSGELVTNEETKRILTTFLSK